MERLPASKIVKTLTLCSFWSGLSSLTLSIARLLMVSTVCGFLWRGLWDKWGSRERDAMMGGRESGCSSQVASLALRPDCAPCTVRKPGLALWDLLAMATLLVAESGLGLVSTAWD